MIGQTESLLHQLIEDKMAKAPTLARRGIPIGSYREIMDDAGKVIIAKKRKAHGAATEIAKRKKRKWRAAK